VDHKTFTLISQQECKEIIADLLDNFRQTHRPYNTSIVPIMHGGGYLGRELMYPTFPMQMSYYNGTKRLDHPRILMEPEYDRLHSNIVLIEAVVDTGETVKTAAERLRYVLRTQYGKEANITCLAAVTKLTEDIGVPVTAAFWVHPDLWVMGWGADYNERGRDLRHVEAFVSPYAEQEPVGELYRRL